MREKFNLGEDSSSWKFINLQNDIKSFDPKKIVPIHYRPFDKKYTYYTGKSNGFHIRPRDNNMNNFLATDNIGLHIPRQSINKWQHTFVTNIITDGNLLATARKFGAGIVCPLYIVGNLKDIQTGHTRIPNLDINIVKKIAQLISLSFTPEKEDNKQTFAPIDILDYIYAILHSPNYRKKYNELLKLDFPYVPYPKNKHQFWQLVALGKKIRQLHLFENPTLNTNQYKFIGKGNLLVEKPEYKNGHVYINKEQYFTHVPSHIWNFYIGGYQPAQKWLKDRKGQKLSFDNISHYLKIIATLNETAILMQEVDNIL